MTSKALSAKPPTVVPTDAELEELGKSLTTKEIPAKLRCGICDLIAYNAIRLPCCSTNICENCFRTELPDDSDECILCHHSPLDKSICSANKSMRTTIRALLKNKFELRLKRQAAEAAKAAKETEHVGAAENGVSASNEPSVSAEKSEDKDVEHLDGDKADIAAPPMEQSISAASIKSAGSRGEDPQTRELSEEGIHSLSHGQGTAADEREKGTSAEGNNAGITDVGKAQPNGLSTNTSSPEQGFTNGAASLNNMNNMNNMNGMFPMGLNSMMNNSMMPMAGFPNMMGMGMMPQMMSQMFGGFDASNVGMNMNAMNVGMGFNAQNQYGNSWMTGQDSYNNNAYGNSSYGDHGGYNMSGNYNSMNDQAYASNDFHRGYGRQGFQNRRGRRGYYNGGYGRHNYNQNHQGNQHGYTNQNASMQQTYPQHQTEQSSNLGADSPVREQAPKEGVTEDAEAEAKMMEELAPGGQHDFDEELGRKPSVDEDHKDVPEDTENADTSISSDSKETLPTETTVEGAVDGYDHVETSAAKKEQTSDQKNVVNDNIETVDFSAATPNNAIIPKEDIAETQEGDNAVADPTPQPIQAFISDEPRSRYAMPPPSSSTAVGSVPPQGTRGYNRSGYAPSNASQTTEISASKPKGLGVAGAPTGPRALRQGLPNVGRSGFESSGTSRPSIPESVGSEHRGRSKSRSPIRPYSPQYAQSRSRSPVRRPSEHHRNKRHRSPSEHSERQRDRREDRHDDKREDKRHRHSHRYHDEEELEAADAKRGSYRSHRRHDKDLEQSDRRRRRDRTRSRSPERDRDQERAAEREKYRYREDDRKEERRHRRRRSRSPENSVAPTPNTPYAPELSNGYEEHGFRKRRSRDYDGEEEQEHYERKRSRRESSPAFEKTNGRYPHQYESSKPSTPITPNFAGASPRSRRESFATNGVPQAQVPTISKPIPTSPRAATQQARPEKRISERDRDRDREVREVREVRGAPKGPAPKPDKDMHTLEREARDRERLQREMQRRAFGGPNRRTSGSSKDLSRRVSYKYEDEDGLDARRVEREREAGRWS